MSEFKDNTTDKPSNRKKVAFLAFGVMLLIFPIFLFSVGSAVDFCDEGWGGWDDRGVFSFFFKQTLFTVYILIGLGYLLAGIFNIASTYLLVEALHLTDASKAVGLYQAMTLFSVFYGIFVLNEKDKLVRKIIGSIILLSQ